jgi:hypothetical protein
VTNEGTQPEVTAAPLTPSQPEEAPVRVTPVVGETGPILGRPALPPADGSLRSGGRLLNVILVLAMAVAIGGVAFAVGRATAPASAVGATGGFLDVSGGAVPGGSFAPGTNGKPGFVRGGLASSPTISGTVESIDGDVLTIKTASGELVTIRMGSDTTYHTQAPADASDVTTGSTVQVQLDLDEMAGTVRPGASAAPDGSIGTADSVTVVP